jgi:TRAP-type C4-dicarboxylate transport system substrate-binding protein
MKMSRKLLTIVSAVAMSLTVTAASAQITLNLNSQMPESAPASEIDRWFADEVARRTDGAVEIKIFYSGTLGRPLESLSLMREGAIDMAVASPGYFSSDIPFTAIPNSFPMSLFSVNQARVVMERLMEEEPELAAEQERNGVRALFFHNLNPYYLLSKEPILTAEDLKGQRTRSWGSDFPRFVSGAGAVPVTLGLSEVYEALSNGAVDVVPFSYDYIQTYRLHEVAGHVTTAPVHIAVTAPIWISTAAWDRLSPEQQKIMLEVADKAAEKDYELTLKAGEEARQFLADNGVEFHEFPEEEMDKLRAVVPDYFGEWIAKMEEQGKGDAARNAIAIWKDVVANVE